MRSLSVTDVRFVPADAEHQATGLLGWISFTLGRCVRIEDVTLRRTREGRLSLSYPGKRVRKDKIRHAVRPVSDRVRRDIEHQVFSKLRREIMT